MRGSFSTIVREGSAGGGDRQDLAMEDDAEPACGQDAERANGWCCLRRTIGADDDGADGGDGDDEGQ
jgi:hypothetical protein